MEQLIYTIRQEQPVDYDEVARLVKASFTAVGHKDESDYLNALRKKPVFIPELSLVAGLKDGTIAGQIVIYHTTVVYENSEDVQLVVSPLSVLPEYFRRGIGSALMREGLRLARDMGYKTVFLWGDPDYYSRLGFIPSYRFNIFYKEFADKEVDFIMAYPLCENALNGEKGMIDIY